MSLSQETPDEEYLPNLPIRNVREMKIDLSLRSERWWRYLSPPTPGFFCSSVKAHRKGIDVRKKYEQKKKEKEKTLLKEKA